MGFLDWFEEEYNFVRYDEEDAKESLHKAFDYESDNLIKSDDEDEIEGENNIVYMRPILVDTSSRLIHIL